MSPPRFMFTVAGTPRPQPRPRFVNGRAVSTASKHAKLWRVAVDRAVRLAISAAARPLPLFVGPVRMSCVFTFEPPAGHEYRLDLPHTQKPDASNLLKLIEDVMETAGVFANDSQIATAEPQKWWGRRPGLVVIVEAVGGLRRPEPTEAAAGAAPSWLTGAADG